MIFILVELLICFLFYLFLMQKKVQDELQIVENRIELLISGDYNTKIISQPKNKTYQLNLLMNQIARTLQEKEVNYKLTEKNYKQLIVNLSHDVRTPLASLSGYVELLSVNKLPDDSKNKIQVIKKKAIELSRYIELLFEWTKLDANEQVLHPALIDINEATRKCITKWISPLEDAGITYTVNIPNDEQYIFLDGFALGRIIDNIIKNSLYHSHASHVSFLVRSTSSDIIMEIEDNGIGLSEEDKTLLFKRIYRTSSSINVEGDGLGLSIVKELVTKSGGCIHINSLPNQMTQFFIRFPYNDSIENNLPTNLQ